MKKTGKYSVRRKEERPKKEIPAERSDRCQDQT
jgi:hypothetical protein